MAPPAAVPFVGEAPPTSADRADLSTPTAPPDRRDRRWPADPPWDACPAPIWPGKTYAGSPGEGERVLLLGDSLTRDSRVLTTRLLHGSGWTPTFRCWGSRRLDWGIDQVTRAKNLDQLPKWVVIGLGTNDISWESPQTTASRLSALIKRLGPKRQVLWINLHLTRSAWLDARADWFNDLLDTWDRRRANFTVIDWHTVARREGIRGWDGIHYGPGGFRLRAHTVVHQLNARARRLAEGAEGANRRPRAAPTATAAP